MVAIYNEAVSNVYKIYLEELKGRGNLTDINVGGTVTLK